MIPIKEQHKNKKGKLVFLSGYRKVPVSIPALTRKSRKGNKCRVDFFKNEIKTPLELERKYINPSCLLELPLVTGQLSCDKHKVLLALNIKPKMFTLPTKRASPS